MPIENPAGDTPELVGCGRMNALGGTGIGFVVAESALRGGSSLVNVVEGGVAFDFFQSLGVGASLKDAFPGRFQHVSIRQETPRFAQGVFRWFPVGRGECLLLIAGRCINEFYNVGHGTLIVYSNVHCFTIKEGHHDCSYLGSCGGTHLAGESGPLLYPFLHGVGKEIYVRGSGSSPGGSYSFNVPRCQGATGDVGVRWC